MKNSPYKNVIIVHPGTQYAYRFANALAKNATINVSLYTWFLLSRRHYLSKFSFFKKRVKNISEKIKVHNFPLYEAFFIVHLKLNRFFKVYGNNPYYTWQVLFGWFLLPMLYFNRKSSILVTFETCGWPLVKYAKKWGIPVIMDFPSISHEHAEKLGIKETAYGKRIKTLERQQINYAISCSNFAKRTYEGLTSAKEHFAVWLGTDFENEHNKQIAPNENMLNICCLANTEQRKGIDILLEAFDKIAAANKKLYLVGNISSNWVSNYCHKNNLSLKNVILTGPKAQQDLKEFLVKEQMNLHILPSRFDSFGMVVPETMALGIPNILSPYVGASEMVAHNVDGFVMQNLEVKELVMFINHYTSLSLGKKIELSKAALKKAEKMTWDNYSGRINLVFDKITSNF